jgi:fibro-slime domain-containing protein
MSKRKRALLYAATTTLVAFGCAAGSTNTDDSSFKSKKDPTDPVLAPEGGLLLSQGNGDGGIATTTGDAEAGTTCIPNLTGDVRDFTDQGPHKHPDFETFVGNGELGIVEPLLGSDDKPVYASSTTTKYTTGKTSFDVWFRDSPEYNIPLKYTLVLTKVGTISTFDSPAFFPIDGQGFGNDGRDHNFSFTFELHTQFQYKGGEVFTFVGDDDLWIFVNKHLAVDLGGVHDAETGSIDFDARAGELGVTKGNIYDLAIFQAERHTPGSHFRIDTSVDLTNCNPPIVQ